MATESKRRQRRREFAAGFLAALLLLGCLALILLAIFLF